MSGAADRTDFGQAGPWHCDPEERGLRWNGRTRATWTGRTSQVSSLPARARTSVRDRVNNSSHDRLRTWCSTSRHSSNGEQPGPPAHRAACFGLPNHAAWRDANATHSGLRTRVFGPRSSDRLGGMLGAVQHGRVHRKECTHRQDGVEPGSMRCLQPGEPHDRLQGATDLHCVCGASRRSREKRHGRNESWIGIPGPTARNEVAVVAKAQARVTICPVRWTPRQAGTAASPERTHTLDVDGGAIFETNPMRGVRQDFGCFARSSHRSHAARRSAPSGGPRTADGTADRLESRRSGPPTRASLRTRKGARSAG